MLTLAAIKWVLLGGVVGLALGVVLGFVIARALWEDELRKKNAVIASLVGKLAASNGKRKRVKREPL